MCHRRRSSSSNIAPTMRGLCVVTSAGTNSVLLRSVLDLQMQYRFATAPCADMFTLSKTKSTAMPMQSALQVSCLGMLGPDLAKAKFRSDQAGAQSHDYTTLYQQVEAGFFGWNKANHTVANKFRSNILVTTSAERARVVGC